MSRETYEDKIVAITGATKNVQLQKLIKLPYIFIR